MYFYLLCMYVSMNKQFYSILLSRLNGLMNCWRRFNVNIMKLYMSGLGHARKLKFSKSVHLLSINQIVQYPQMFCI